MPNENNEINKNLMFQKLMPSSNTTPSTSEQLPILQKKITISDNFVESSFKNDNMHEQIENNFLPHTNQNNSNNISFPTAEEGELVNKMEQIVMENIESILARFNCCKCKRCRKDIIAITMNTLPPKYVVKKPDNEPKEPVDVMLINDVSAAIVRAVVKVRSAPRH